MEGRFLSPKLQLKSLIRTALIFFHIALLLLLKKTQNTTTVNHVWGYMVGGAAGVSPAVVEGSAMMRGHQGPWALDPPPGTNGPGPCSQVSLKGPDPHRAPPRISLKQR